MIPFFDSMKPGSTKLPLDGSERARLVNMRLNRLVPLNCEPRDLISIVHRNPGKLSDERNASKWGFQRWFMRGMDDYVPRSLSAYDDAFQYWTDDGMPTLRMKG